MDPVNDAQRQQATKLGIKLVVMKEVEETVGARSEQLLGDVNAYSMRFLSEGGEKP